MKYELIIFDCDGTLIDSEPIAIKVIHQLFQKLGIQDLYEEISKRFAGTNMNAIIKYAEGKINSELPFDFEKEYRIISNEKFRTELQVFEGAIELIEKLPIPYCIGSNGPHEKMDVTLNCTGLDAYFNKKNTFSAYDYGKWKPDPTLYESIVSQYKIPKTKALVIDDTKHGVMGAINAGIDVFAFCPKYTDPWFEEKNVPVFNNMKSIEKQIFASN